MTESEFDFDAPQFCDFAQDLGHNEDATTIEAYFAVDREKDSITRQHNGHSIDDGEREMEQEFFSPMGVTPDPSNAGESLYARLRRRSISMGNLVQINDVTDGLSIAMKKLVLSSNKKKPASVRNAATGVCTMITRASAPKLNLRSRSISRDHIDRLAQPKCKNVSHEDLQVKKYVSMAEAINKFQKATPVRFRSKPKLDVFNVLKAGAPIANTIPQSPALLTKKRIRPVHALSREEQEIKEFQEEQKFKIKANPISNACKGPMRVREPLLSRPVTIPEPFHMTLVPSKKTHTSPSSQKGFEFHAKPVPKTLFEPPKPIFKPHLATKPCSPNFSKRYLPPKREVENSVATNAHNTTMSSVKLTSTQIQPFSFEQRDKTLIQKKEERIKKVLEDEKKMREFHARPAPKCMFKSPQSKVKHMSSVRQSVYCASTASSSKSEENIPILSAFKARPATVLQLPPFEPKKVERTLVEISEFQLNTDRRAKEREEFELRVRQKEEFITEAKKTYEMGKIMKEQEEAARMRREAVSKANPIRRYKELKPASAKELTVPISPAFGAKNKENS